MKWVCMAAVVLAGLLCLVSCDDHTPPAQESAEIVSFYYSHSGSSTFEMYSYQLEVDAETGEATVEYDINNGIEIYSLPADDELVREIAALVERSGLRSWDGYNGTNSLVQDGTGFHLTIGFADGTEVTASGRNRFPEGYSEASETIKSLFESYLEGKVVRPDYDSD